MTTLSPDFNEAATLEAAEAAFGQYVDVLRPAYDAIGKASTEIPGYLGCGATATIVDLGYLDESFAGDIAKIYYDPRSSRAQSQIDDIGMETQARGLARATKTNNPALQQLKGWSPFARTVISTKVPGEILHDTSAEQIAAINPEQMLTFYDALRVGIEAGVSFNDRHSANTVIDAHGNLGAIDFTAHTPSRAPRLSQMHYKSKPNSARQAAHALVASGEFPRYIAGRKIHRIEDGWLEKVEQISKDAPHLAKAIDNRASKTQQQAA